VVLVRPMFQVDSCVHVINNRRCLQTTVESTFKHSYNHTLMATTKSIDELQSLSIIKLSEPLLSAAENGDHREAGRVSDASSTAPQSDTPTPASLQADLTHYKVFYEVRDILNTYRHAIGTLHKVEVQLCRASDEREVPTCSRWRSTTLHISVSKQCSRVTTFVGKGNVEGAKDRSRRTTCGTRAPRTRIEPKISRYPVANCAISRIAGPDRRDEENNRDFGGSART